MSGLKNELLLFDPNRPALFIQCCAEDQGRILWQDWNGDHRADLICQTIEGGYRVFLSQGTASLIPVGLRNSPTSTQTTTETLSAKQGSMTPIGLLHWAGSQALFIQCCVEDQGRILWQDWNGDHRADLICQKIEGGYEVFLSQGTASLIPVGLENSPTFTQTTTDTVTHSTPSPTETPSAKQGSMTSIGLLHWTGSQALFIQCCVEGQGRILWQDWNGDHRADLICQTIEGGYRVFLSQGTASLIPVGLENSPTSTQTTTDTVTYSLTTTITERATDTDTPTPITTPSPTETRSAKQGSMTPISLLHWAGSQALFIQCCAEDQGRILWQDWNGDHRADLICQTIEGGYGVFLSQGTASLIPVGLENSPTSSQTTTDTATYSLTTTITEGATDTDTPTLITTPSPTETLSAKQGSMTSIGLLHWAGSQALFIQCCVEDQGRILWQDWNGDHRADLICQTIEGGYGVFLSQGTASLIPVGLENSSTSTQTTTDTVTYSLTTTITERATDTDTPTPITTPSPTETLSATRATTTTPSPTASETETATYTGSPTSTTTRSPTETLTATRATTTTPSPTASETETATYTGSTTSTATRSPTETLTATVTTATTASPTVTETKTVTHTGFTTPITTASITERSTTTDTTRIGDAADLTLSLTTTYTSTGYSSQSVTLSEMRSQTVSKTPSLTRPQTETSTETDTTTPSSTDSHTLTETATTNLPRPPFATIAGISPLTFAHLIAWVNNAERKDHQDSLPRGWILLKTSTDPGIPAGTKQTDYLGVAFIKEQQVIIVHRVTEPAADWQSIQNAWNNLPKQLQPARIFVDYLLQNFSRIQQYLLTGYSLGGSLAEQLSVQYSCPAVTFDSPGLPQDSLRALNSSTRSLIQDRIITFCGTPNTMNTLGDHPGLTYRLYPSIDSLSSIPFQPNLNTYIQNYSVMQHAMQGLLTQFDPDTGLPRLIGQRSPAAWISAKDAYPEYASYDQSPYYWNAYLTFFTQDLLANQKWVLSWITEQIGPQSSNFLYGVNITGDHKNHTLWGTTNYDDITITGIGDDLIYLHRGNDIAYDQGGFDRYICSLSFMGKKTIHDQEGQGRIQIEDVELAGIVLPVSETRCTIMKGAYVLHLPDRGAYYFIEQNATLWITSECAHSLQDIQNGIVIDPFRWGDLGIQRYTGTDKIVLVGSNDNDSLDCSVYRSASLCLAFPFDGQDTIIIDRKQNAEVRSSPEGKKTFEFVNKGKTEKDKFSLLEAPGTGSYQILIGGLKGSDVLNLAIGNREPPLQVKQNGIQATIDLDNQTRLSTLIEMGNPYVTLVHEPNNTITVYSWQNMTQLINGPVSYFLDELTDKKRPTYTPTINHSNHVNHTASGTKSVNPAIIIAAVVLPLSASIIGGALYLYFRKRHLAPNNPSTVSQEMEIDDNHLGAGFFAPLSTPADRVLYIGNSAEDQLPRILVPSTPVLQTTSVSISKEADGPRWVEEPQFGLIQVPMAQKENPVELKSPLPVTETAMPIGFQGTGKASAPPRSSASVPTDHGGTNTEIVAQPSQTDNTVQSSKNDGYMQESGDSGAYPLNRIHLCYSPEFAYDNWILREPELFYQLMARFGPTMVDEVLTLGSHTEFHTRFITVRANSGLDTAIATFWPTTTIVPELTSTAQVYNQDLCTIGYRGTNQGIESEKNFVPTRVNSYFSETQQGLEHRTTEPSPSRGSCAEPPNQRWVIALVLYRLPAAYDQVKNLIKATGVIDIDATLEHYGIMEEAGQIGTILRPILVLGGATASYAFSSDPFTLLTAMSQPEFGLDQKSTAGDALYYVLSISALARSAIWLAQGTVVKGIIAQLAVPIVLLESIQIMTHIALDTGLVEAKNPIVQWTQLASHTIANGASLLLSPSIPLKIMHGIGLVEHSMTLGHHVFEYLEGQRLIEENGNTSETDGTLLASIEQAWW